MHLATWKTTTKDSHAKHPISNQKGSHPDPSSLAPHGRRDDPAAQNPVSQNRPLGEVSPAGCGEGTEEIRGKEHFLIKTSS